MSKRSLKHPDDSVPPGMQLSFLVQDGWKSRSSLIDSTRASLSHMDYFAGCESGCHREAARGWLRIIDGLLPTWRVWRAILRGCLEVPYLAGNIRLAWRGQNTSLVRPRPESIFVLRSVLHIVFSSGLHAIEIDG